MYFNVAVHRILKSNKFVYIKSGMAFLYLLQINKKLFTLHFQNLSGDNWLNAMLG